MPQGDSFSALTAPSTVVYNPDPSRFRYTLPTIFMDTARDPQFFSGGNKPTATVTGTGTGSNFQTLLNNAARDSVIIIPDNANLEGTFTLPAKAGTGWIYIMSQSAYNGSLPAEGTRITASQTGLASIQNTNGLGPIQTVDSASSGNASYYRLIGLRIKVKSGYTSGVAGGLVVFGGGTNMTDATRVPHHLIVDQCYLHGYDFPANNNPVQRGVTMNGAYCALIDSRVEFIYWWGVECQAVGGWKGPGPFKIVNNYLSSAGEVFLYGSGSPFPYSGYVPSNFEIRRNHMKVPLAWNVRPTSPRPTVKNIFEFKTCLYALVECNIFENCWVDAQTGQAILFQSVGMSQGPDRDPVTGYNTVQDISFHYNKLIRAAGGPNIPCHPYGAASGETTHPTDRIELKHFLSIELGDATALNNGSPVDQVQGYGASFYGGGIASEGEITIDHMTSVYSANAVYSTNRKTAFFLGEDPTKKIAVFRCLNSIFQKSLLAVESSGGQTNPLTGHCTSYEVNKNVFVGATESFYPAGNWTNSSFSTDAALGLDADYRPSLASGLRGAATDGLDVGCDVLTLSSALTGVSD